MDIEQALEAFRVLLTEQQNRVANMNTEKTDFLPKPEIWLNSDSIEVFPMYLSSLKKTIPLILLWNFCTELR